MDINEFIVKFAEAIEVENVEDLKADTVFKELEEWSSLSVMLLIAFFDEEFGREISEDAISSANNIFDLYQFAIE